MRALLLLLLGAVPASAQVSSGGAYQLERSAIASGGDLGAGGDVSVRASIGPTAGSQPSESFVVTGGAYELRVGVLNPPPFALSASSPAVVELEGGAVTLAMPAGVVSLAAYDVAFRQDPAAEPLAVDANKILEASRKLELNDPLARIKPENIWEFHLSSEQGYYTGNFAAPLLVSFAYTDANGDGVVDGTNPPLRAKTLSVWTLDEATARWVKVQGAVVDSVSRKVTVPVAHFSVYAFVGGADDEVAAAHAFPVPFRPNGPEAGLGPGQTGTAATGITFTNLPTEGSIEIYTLGGQLVRRIDIPFGLGVPQLVWDVRNRVGEAVASGVYIWKVASKNAFKTGRLMVIR